MGTQVRILEGLLFLKKMQQLPVIDIHGKTVKEANLILRQNLKSFHDQGFLEVTIIHGHGTGVLKDYVRSFLNQLYYVKNMTSSNNDGATVAHF